MSQSAEESKQRSTPMNYQDSQGSYSYNSHHAHKGKKRRQKSRETPEEREHRRREFHKWLQTHDPGYKVRELLKTMTRARDRIFKGLQFFYIQEEGSKNMF